MSHLHFFNDLMSELKQPHDEEESVFEEETKPVEVVSVSSEKVNVTSPKAKQKGDVTDVIKLKDVSAILPCREMKLHCEQIADTD